MIILDEPTAGIDPARRVSVRNLIAEIALDRIVLTSTHFVPDVEYTAERIIMLKSGVVVGNGSPKEILREIDGMVWETVCEKENLSELEARFPVTSISRDALTGKIKIRLLSDTCPTESAVPVTPGLEDRYLFTFGKKTEV